MEGMMMRAQEPVPSSRRRGAAHASRLLLCLLVLPLWMAAQTAAGNSAAAPAGSGLSPDQPRVTYSRSFKGSQPAFLQVIIQQNGAAEYQARESDNQPIQRFPFTASPDTVTQVFQLAKQAGNFRKPLEDKHSKVSYMGTKMLAYDGPAQHQQQVFNFTRVKPAYDLQLLFERIADTGEHALKLQESMQYDRLGVVKELNLIRLDWSQQQMLEPGIIVPTLQKIANDQNLMEIARKRAAVLVQEMTTPPANVSQK